MNIQHDTVLVNRNRRAADLALRFKSLLILLCLCLIVSILNPRFLTMTNIMNVARQTSINAVIAMGMMFVILTGGIDLSVGSVLAFSSCIAGALIQSGCNYIVAMLASLAVGALIGLINGAVISRLSLAPFIVTLSSMSIFRGLTLVFTGGMPISGLGDDFSSVGAGYFLGIPNPVIIMIIVFLVILFVTNKTKYGRHVYALGGNEEAARLSGIRTSLVKMSVYAISGFLSALSGLIVAARLSSAQPDAGTSYEMDAIAAVVIGGVSMSIGGKGSVSGVIVGALIIGVINNALNLLNISPFWQQAVRGLVILFAVVLDRITSKKTA